MSPAVLLAVAASIFWGMGTAMQKHGVETSFPKITLSTFFSQIGSILKALIRNPAWAIGLISMIGGMLTYAYSLANGDISVVQPIVNLTLVVAVIIGVLFLREKVSPLEWAALFVICSGVVLIALQGEAKTSVRPGTGALLALCGVFFLLTLASLFADKLKLPLSLSFRLAAAAGFSFGLSNVMGKVMTQRIIEKAGVFSLADPNSLIAILLDFPIWLIVGANVAGFAFSQTAFANGRISVISPVMTIISNTTPVVAAVAVFSEQLSMTRGAGILLAVIGVAMFAMKKEDADQPITQEVTP